MDSGWTGVWKEDERSPGVAWSHRPSAKLAAVRLFVAGGSSADGRWPGLTHVCEHVLAGREAPAGMLVSGETGREYLAISVRCQRQDAVQAVHWLHRVISDDICDPEAAVAVMAAAGEAARAHSGRAAIWNVLCASLWGDHPLARPTSGDRAVIAGIDGAVADDHLRRLLVAGGVWLGVAGDFGPDRVIEKTRELDWHLGPGPVSWPDPPAVGRPGRRELTGDGAEPIVAAAWPVPGGFGREAQALRLAEAMIGGPRGRFARRPEGFAALALYRRAGYMAALARPRSGEEPEALNSLLSTVCVHPDESEIGCARRTYPVQALAELDSCFRAAGAGALHALTGGPPPGQWIREVTDLSSDDVTAAFDRWLRPDRCHVLIVRG